MVCRRYAVFRRQRKSLSHQQSMLYIIILMVSPFDLYGVHALTETNEKQSRGYVWVDVLPYTM